VAKRPIATLLTDFGRGDPYVAAMKGVILSACPRAELVDISHEVTPGDVLAGAYVLVHSAPHFPPGTVHVVVVDPGVGTQRRILAGRFGRQVYLFPDNGIITLVAQKLPMEALFSVRNPDFLPPPSAAGMTFHGRDIFAPVAGHILNGLDIRRLGPTPKTYKTLEVPAARLEGGGIVGQVVYVDRFGNLVSNIPWEMVRRAVRDPDRATVRCAGRDVGPLRGTYGFAEPGRPLALINSMSLVEVAVNGGRASDALGAGVGSEVRMVVGDGPGAGTLPPAGDSR